VDPEEGGEAVRRLAFLLALAGCAHSPKRDWTPLDQSSAADIAGASTSLEAICDRNGGSCNPAAVRSIEQSIFCAARAMAQRHGNPLPTGPACPTVAK
jgi:hypothetical protein